MYAVFLTALTAFGLSVLNPMESTCKNLSFNFILSITWLQMSTYFYLGLVGIEVINKSFNGSTPENCEGSCTAIEVTIIVVCILLELTSEKHQFLIAAAVITILVAVLRLLIEVVQLCRHPIEYLQDWVNWLEMPLYLCSIIFTFVFGTPCLCVYRWQWQIGVVSVFLAWIVLITFLQKWPVTGVYVLMFLNIIQTFLKIAYLALLLITACTSCTIMYPLVHEVQWSCTSCTLNLTYVPHVPKGTL